MNTEQQDQELLASYLKTRDIDLRNKIVENHIPLVKYVVSKMYYCTCGEYDYDDLVNCGVFGLIKAVEKFDPKKKVKFSTFAFQKIQFSIIDELRRIDQVPRSVRYKIRLVQKYLAEAESGLGYDIDRKQLAEMFNMSPTDFQVMEGTYCTSAEDILDYVYDHREMNYDYVLCRCPHGAPVVPSANR